MILVDYSQLSLNVILGVGENPTGNIYDTPEQLITHLILNKLRTYNTRFKRKYGDIVVCLEGRRNWRSDIFPNYKIARKSSRKDSNIDWDRVYVIMEDSIKLLQTTFPYSIIRVEKCEADDVIGVLSKLINEPNLIVSSDKDFGQLKSHHNVDIFDPRKEAFVTLEITPQQLLLEHVIQGDNSDSIPNILTGDDHFISEIRLRQKAITAKYKENFLPRLRRGELTQEEIANFKRNSSLIDLNSIPKDIKLKILETFENYKIEGNMQKVMQYFIENGFSNFLDCIEDFS